VPLLRKLRNRRHEVRRARHVRGRPHLGQTSILYARAPGLTERWRRYYAKLALRLVAEAPWYRLSSRISRGAFAGPELSSAVDRAAMKAVQRYLTRRRYDVEDKHRENLGYDPLARRGRRAPELHVEVKGTSGAEPHFYMSAREFTYRHHPSWRLAVVSEALSKPVIRLMTLRDVEAAFGLNPCMWEGVMRPRES
jgi:uncharacterized protein DUF3883